jgi:hypothetical protein
MRVRWHNMFPQEPEWHSTICDRAILCGSTWRMEEEGKRAQGWFDGVLAE